MKKFFGLAAFGCLGMGLFALLIGGVAAVGYGLYQFAETLPVRPDNGPVTEFTEPANPGPGAATNNLLEARLRYRTQLSPIAPPLPSAAPPPPPPWCERVQYPAPLGPLYAHITPVATGERRPAIVFAHAGHSPRLPLGQPVPTEMARLRDSGCVVMVPTWRGESGNPGRFEYLYGELDDLLAAIEFVARRPDVDPRRIYLIGSEAGATLALLASVATDRCRGIIAINGVPEIGDYLRTNNNRVGFLNYAAPFVAVNPEEYRLRSAIHFTASIRTPTCLIQSSTNPLLLGQGRRMLTLAQQSGAPFYLVAIPDGGRPAQEITARITQHVAEKIRFDTDLTTPFALDPQEITRLFEE